MSHRRPQGKSRNTAGSVYGSGSERGDSDDDKLSEDLDQDDEDEEYEYNNNNKHKNAPKKKELSLFDESAADAQMASELSKYKCVVFEMEGAKGFRNRKIYCLSDPRSTEHVTYARPSFIEAYKEITTPLGFALKAASSVKNNNLQDMLIKRAGSEVVKTDKSVEKNASILLELKIIGVGGSCQVPMSVNLTGLTEGYINPCSANWSKDKDPLAVLHPGFPPLTVSKLDVEAEPFFYSMLGGNAAQTDNSQLKLWGDRVDQFIQVHMNSGKFIWLMYNLPVFLIEYSKTSKPSQYITEDIVTDMKAFVKKNPIPEIYRPDVDMKDNYMGRVADAVLKAKKKKSSSNDFCWEMTDQMTEKYVVPFEFLAWCVETHYNPAMKKIRAIQENVSMSLCPAVLKSNNEMFTEKDFISFQVEMVIYRPAMIVFNQQIVAKK